MNEKFVRKVVDERGDGLDVQRVVQVGSGNTSGGGVTDDSGTCLYYPICVATG